MTDLVAAWLGLVVLSAVIGCNQQERGNDEPAGKTASIRADNKARKPDAPDPAEAMDERARPHEPNPVHDPPKPDARPTRNPLTRSYSVAAACDAYKAAIDRLATCPSLSRRIRNALVREYKDLAAVRRRPAADSHWTLGSWCDSGTDAVTQAAKKPCGW